MKIHVLPVSQAFQPASQTFRYPGHNDDYDVEQDFLAYLTAHPELLAASSEEADWSYLPIFWTRWHMSHSYGSTGLVELQAEVDRLRTDRMFTVCLYEDGPLVDVGDAVLLTATRKATTKNAIDIPTLCSPHQGFRVEKRYKASFVGRLHTHALRREMTEALDARSDVLIQDGDFGERVFVETLLASHLALCPTGGSGSFRFYEAMQLGVVPLLIHPVDTRPFKRAIDWSACSLYLASTDGLKELLDRMDAVTLQSMGFFAGQVYQKFLAYQAWCPHALEELAA